MNRLPATLSRRALCRLSAALALAALAPLPALAQSYPSKPVQVVVPFAPGGPADILARALGERLSGALKQPVIVVNQAGAGGNIGGRAVAQAQPDGHTLLFTLDSALTANPTLYGNRMGYDVERDLRPIATLISYGQTLVLHPGVKARTFGEFVELARTQGITYASAGNASPGHLAMEQLGQMIDAKLIHVPYRGAAPAVADLLGGQVQAGFLVTPGVVPHVQAGKLVPLVVSSAQRSDLLPRTPTVTEAGHPGATIEFSMVLMAPKATPDAVVRQLNAEVKKALGSEEMRTLLKANDMVAVADTPEEAAARLKATTAKMSALIRTRGIRAD